MQPQRQQDSMPHQQMHEQMQQGQLHEQMQQGQMQRDQMGSGQATATGSAATATSAIIVGEVLDMRDVKIRAPVEDTHRVIKVETRNGSTALVDIGNARQYGQVNFRKGDRIVAVGKKARLDERPVLFAKTVGELHSVGRHTVQSAAVAPGRSEGGLTGPAAETPNGDEVPQVALYYFQTDNLETDRYGTYDEDFAWETDDPWYSNWSDADVGRGDQYGAAEDEIYGYGDVDDWGVWDW
jgi:hypothetical protein